MILSAAAAPALANHGTRQLGAPVTAAEAALSSLYANPPLPMTAFKAGDHKVMVMLDYFGVQKPAGDGSSESPADVSKGSGLQGLGGAVLYDHALFDWGSLYGLFMGARLGPGRINGRASSSFLNSPANSKADTVFQGADSRGSVSLAFSVGANARLVGDSPDGFSVGTFIGPIVYMTQGSGSAVFLNNQTAANSSECAEAFAGYACVKRNYNARATTFGVLAGIQANIPIGKKFAANPFLIALPSNALSRGGDIIDSDHVRFDQPIRVGTSGGIPVTTSQTDYVRAIPPFSLGLNATYRPWGLSANLTGSVFTMLTNKVLELQGNKILKLQVSKSFGSFPK
ncbi:MAG: hypothetical protein HY554_03860 [Elusimicrobia bacterium]|nr:hypothetical protein [Elusimicrobiota bacterium]